MFKTKYGAFDGTSWEELCQIIFKRRYEDELYQKIPASPGDFGLEGFTNRTGKGFQCYCPSTHYDKHELYEKQRDKITTDLNKLKTYEEELKARLGETKLSVWIFVTPEFDKNELIKHARKKEEEVKSWGLSIIGSDFKIVLYDADNYARDIREHQQAVGEALVFTDFEPIATLEPDEQYEKNIDRKNRVRLELFKDQEIINRKVIKLNAITTQSFLSCDAYLREIENSAPTLHYRLVRLIREFEYIVIEKNITWTGTAEELLDKLKNMLVERIEKDLSPNFDSTSAEEVARRMIARWIAICEFDYE